MKRQQTSQWPLLDKVPAEIRHAVRARAEEVASLPIDPDRIVICACLLVAAERTRQCYLPKGRTVSMAPTDLIGEWWFDITPKSEDDELEVKRRYAEARKAMQEIYESAKKARRGAQRLLALLDKHDQAMPIPFRHFRDDLREVLGPWDKLSAELLDHVSPQQDAMKRARPKEPNEQFAVKQQALVWWYRCLSGKRIGWRGLLDLARCWDLSDCADERHLQRVVVRLIKRATQIEPPPEWCLNLCL